MLQRCLQRGAASARVRAFLGDAGMRVPACLCMCACVHAHSPLARLLLSMYIAQQNTNPVIKKNVGAGRVRLSRSTAGEETGSLHSHTDSRTHAHTGSLTHTRAPVRPSGTIRSRTDRLTEAERRSAAPGMDVEETPARYGPEGCPVCVSARRRQSASGGE